MVEVAIATVVVVVALVVDVTGVVVVTFTVVVVVAVVVGSTLYPNLTKCGCTLATGRGRFSSLFLCFGSDSAPDFGVEALSTPSWLPFCLFLVAVKSD